MGRKPKLKIGDVIECVYPESWSEQVGDKAIVITETDIDVVESCDSWWFSGEDGYVGITFVPSIRRCKGARTKKLCRTCKQSDFCYHLQAIARCEFSEFAQYRKAMNNWDKKSRVVYGIGMPLDTEACVKCKKHRSFCWSRRFILQAKS